MNRDLLTAPMVAKKLARSLGWFSKHRESLEQEHGFPPSVRGMGMRWDPVAIDRWLDSQIPNHEEREAKEAEVRLLRRLADPNFARSARPRRKPTKQERKG